MKTHRIFRPLLAGSLVLLSGVCLSSNPPLAQGEKIPFIQLDEQGHVFLYRTRTHDGVDDSALTVGEEKGMGDQVRGFLRFAGDIYLTESTTDEDLKNSRHFTASLLVSGFSSTSRSSRVGAVAELGPTSRCYGCPLATETPLGIQVFRWPLDQERWQNWNVDVLIHGIGIKDKKWATLKQFRVPLGEIKRLVGLSSYSDVTEILDIEQEVEVQSYDQGKKASFTNPMIVHEGKRHLVSATDLQSYTGACKNLGFADLDSFYRDGRKPPSWEQPESYQIPSVRLDENGKVIQVEQVGAYVRVLSCVR